MIEYAKQAFLSVQLCKVLHDYGKLDELGTGWSIEEDTWWSLTYEALNCVCGAIWMDGNEDYMQQKYYFSDPDMMEYYRHCREYCNLFGVKLKDNPYMKKAEKFVYDMLCLDTDDYGYTLHTKINHKWASGIVFVYGDYFNGYIELVEALLLIFDFYKNELAELKSVLEAQKNNIEKEAA